MARHFTLRVGQPPAPTSQLWPHMRTSTWDFSIEYLPQAQRAAQYDWMVTKYDAVIGGTQTEYNSRRPAMVNSVYDLIWGPEVANRVVTIENWLTNNWIPGHPTYDIEDAFLHLSGTSKIKANRVVGTVYGSSRNVINAGDAGVLAYHTARNTSLTAIAETVMYDEVSTESMNNTIPVASLEYPSRADWYTDFQTLLSTLAAQMAGGKLEINIGNYTTATDTANAVAGGWPLYEFANDILKAEGTFSYWSWLDARLAAGLTGSFVVGPAAMFTIGPETWPTKTNYTQSRYATIRERNLMQLYCNYLMVVDANAVLLYFDPHCTGRLDTTHDLWWLTAFEYNIGLASSGRTLKQGGTDPLGQQCRIYERRFANAVVYSRPMALWSDANGNYGTASAVTVNLPAGTWQELDTDGTLKAGNPTTVTLNMSEAAIFIDVS